MKPKAIRNRRSRTANTTLHDSSTNDLVFEARQIPIMKSDHVKDWLLTTEQEQALVELICAVKPKHQAKVREIIVPMCRMHAIQARKIAREAARTTKHGGRSCFEQCAVTREQWFNRIMDRIVEQCCPAA